MMQEALPLLVFESERPHPAIGWGYLPGDAVSTPVGRAVVLLALEPGDPPVRALDLSEAVRHVAGRRIALMVAAGVAEGGVIVGPVVTVIPSPNGSVAHVFRSGDVSLVERPDPGRDGIASRCWPVQEILRRGMVSGLDLRRFGEGAEELVDWAGATGRSIPGHYPREAHSWAGLGMVLWPAAARA